MISLAAARVGDDGATCDALMDLMSVLSPVGLKREVLYLAGWFGALADNQTLGSVDAQAVDAALGRLAGMSLLTFSVDAATVTAHRMVMRVVRERLDAEGRLLSTIKRATDVIEYNAQSGSGDEMTDHMLSLAEHAESCSASKDTDLSEVRETLYSWIKIYPR